DRPHGFIDLRQTAAGACRAPQEGELVLDLGSRQLPRQSETQRPVYKPLVLPQAPLHAAWQREASRIRTAAGQPVNSYVIGHRVVDQLGGDLHAAMEDDAAHLLSGKRLGLALQRLDYDLFAAFAHARAGLADVQDLALVVRWKQPARFRCLSLL